MSKILITGGLGYIGTALTNLYLNNLEDDITIIDKKRDPLRENQFQNNNIEFIEIDILNKKELRKIVSNSNIIYHLAGVTDVPRLKNDNVDMKNEEIYQIGVNGTRNILETASRDAKIIFPSTHVVFEGLEKVKLEISEEESTQPLLTYAETKVTNENEIKDSDLNYVILRLGSVHGFVANSTRLNIMPNIFSKIAAEKGEINLHGGGKQLKSLVSVFDVAAALKYTAENNELQKELFHCVSENILVKDVAKICKTIVDEVKINISNEKVPNQGYGLSSKKLMATGFNFKVLLLESITEMINEWKNGK
tara:strand:+ start:11753 stop:12676 length:924 start_codon:yes stop_codon:yes gene_type:complete